MNIQSFMTNFTCTCNSSKDVLSVFKESSQRSTEIQQGMSVREISDVVSDKIIAVFEEQFRITKVKFLKKEKT